MLIYILLFYVIVLFIYSTYMLIHTAFDDKTLLTYIEINSVKFFTNYLY